MGVIATLLQLFFGGGRNVVKEVLETLTVNAEAGDQRDAAARSQALQQLAAEFSQARSGWFDRFVDGLNRLPRPMLALGTLGLMAMALIDPVWFAARMQGVALVPEPLWWLMGAIVGFYFGARVQTKGQDFQRSIAATMLMAGDVTRNIGALRALGAGAAPASDDNAALADWRRQNG